MTSATAELPLDDGAYPVAVFVQSCANFMTDRP